MTVWPTQAALMSRRGKVVHGGGGDEGWVGVRIRWWGGGSSVGMTVGSRCEG